MSNDAPVLSSLKKSHEDTILLYLGAGGSLP